MPTPNYAFEKRQRELAKKKKKEEKLQRKADSSKEPLAPADDGSELPVPALPSNEPPGSN